MSGPLALVTGAPGWLGTRLVECLLHGLPDVPALAHPLGERPVRCLVMRGSNKRWSFGFGDRVRLVEGDLTDPALVDAFVADAEGATLFHCAGIIHPVHGTRELYEVNVEGTRRLVDAAKRSRVRRMVYVSSNSPIGTNPRSDHLFDESSPYDPYMAYGRSKMLAEQIVRAAGESGHLETTTIRPPWFYGPGQPPRQSLFFTMIEKGTVPILGVGDHRRSMAYIDNVCQGALLSERVEQARGGVYWIADRRPYSMNEIIGTIERVLERDFGVAVAHKRRHLPSFVGDVAWFVDKGLQSVGLYQQKVHVLSEMNKTIVCSIARAERELGYEPKIELEEGMRRSIAWMRREGRVPEP